MKRRRKKKKSRKRKKQPLQTATNAKPWAKISQHALILVIAGAVLAFVFGILQNNLTQAAEHEQTRIERGYAYKQTAIAEVYAPLYHQLLMHLDEPMPVTKYVELINEVIKDKDAFLVGELGSDYVTLITKNREYNRTPIISTEKETKKRELLEAALVFNARFNEQMVSILTEYYTEMGHHKPNYEMTQLEKTNSSLILIKLTGNNLPMQW